MDAKKMSYDQNAYRFRNWMKERNLTARRVSEITKVSYSSINAYMQGSRYPSRFTKQVFREKLGMRVEEVFRD